MELEKECRHQHLTEIILSKEEYEYQIKSFFDWSDLLLLLKNGTKWSDDETLLQKIGMKLEVIGNFVYADESTGTAKAPAAFYEKYMFESFCEDEEELKFRMKDIYSAPISDGMIRKIFRKYEFTAKAVSSLLADEEIWWAGSYEMLIAYAALHKPCSSLPEETKKEILSVGFNTSWRA